MTAEMSLEAFAKCLAVLVSGIGKPMQQEQVRVYHEMLKDLPEESLRLAVRRALCEHEFATVPSIAMLRRLATEQDDSGWQLASQQVTKAAKIAFYQPSEARALMDPRTLAALESIGGLDRLHELTPENRGTFTAQLRSSYEAIERTETKSRLRTGIEGPERESVEARAVAGLAGRLGVTR